MQNTSADSFEPDEDLVHSGLKTPRAAAIAGIFFSILLTTSLWLLWSSVPINPHETGSWLKVGSERVSLALNLVPFAGIAFLWFLGYCAIVSASGRTSSLRPFSLETG